MRFYLLLLFATLFSIISVSAQQAHYQKDAEDPLFLPLLNCPGFNVYCFPSSGHNLTEEDVALDIFWLFPGFEAATKFHNNLPFNKVRIWGVWLYGFVDDVNKIGPPAIPEIRITIYDKRPDDPEAVAQNFVFKDIAPNVLIDFSDYENGQPSDDVNFFFVSIDLDFEEDIDIIGGWIHFNFMSDALILKREMVSIFLPIGNIDERYADEDNPESLLFIPEHWLSSETIIQSLDNSLAPVYERLGSYLRSPDAHTLADRTNKNGGMWVPYDFKPFFALSTDTPPVPLSSRALILAGIMILGFVAFRFFGR